MRKSLPLATAFAVSLVFAGCSYGAPSSTYSAGDAAGGIATTRHNLGSLGSFTIAVNTTEICVFCHTPHHTSTTARPLWNRNTPASTFTAYGTTIAGTVTEAPGGTSLACLSCHDGVTTLDTIINAPGKGGVTSTATAQGWQFYTNSNPLNPSSVNAFLGNSPTLGFDPRINIGTDLSNDHPVSIVYNSTVASLRPETTILSSIDLKLGMSTSAVTFDSGNLTRNLWDVKGYIKDNATIGDLLRNGKVECASCHDPHFGNATGASIDQGIITENASPSGLFLRRVGGNVGSGVCRTCHNK